MKYVINRCYGGFGLSDEAMALYREYSGRRNTDFSYYDIKRNDPFLVAVVEELGERSWGSFAQLRIVEVPDGTEVYIDDYDGMESIHEEHRSWS